MHDVPEALDLEVLVLIQGHTDMPWQVYIYLPPLALADLASFLLFPPPLSCTDDLYYRLI